MFITYNMYCKTNINMVVMTESILKGNNISNQCIIQYLVLDSRTEDKMENNENIASPENVLPIVRSVAMSENIAQSVRDEVNHFIHVESTASSVLSGENFLDAERDPFSLGKTEYNLQGTNSVSYILPSTEDNIISAVILSKWDDIIGPQTVHVWMRDDARSTPCHHAHKCTCLIKSVKYVTSHTVNYTGSHMSISSSNANVEEKNSMVFVVPELELVAQSLMFQFQSHKLNVPYSLALMVSYRHYKYFLHLRQLFRNWLQRMSARLHVILSKSLKFESTDQVNDWILGVSNMMFSLKTYGLAAAHQMHNFQVPNHPLLERILTSHLQTFGCTVVMGTSSEDINSMILFLGLFLDTDELHCSRFVLPPGNNSFHAGLFLQGLLMNEFGCRDLCSIELAANPYPVTAVDLSRSSVKQTPLYHLHLAHRCQMAQREHNQLYNEYVDEEPGHQLHESVLHPVKEEAGLVCSLLEDLRHLPSSLWLTYIRLFRHKLDTLAYSLLNLVCWMSGECEKLGYSKYLGQALDLSEADLLIVLAVAEKLQPGIYSYVMSSR